MAVKPGDKPVAAGVEGLTLQASTRAGRGKWNLRFTSPVTGKRRDMGLGVFPDVGVADALDKAEQARKQIASGADPIIAKAEATRIPTFERAARERWEQVKPSFKNSKHAAQWIASLEQHIFPSLGDLRVDALTPRHFADALRPLLAVVPETGKRVRQRCHDTMAMCWAHGYTQGNPLDVVQHLLPATDRRVVAHQPAMPWRDVPRFVLDCLSKPPVLGARAALLFVILTAARSGEVRGVTWGEIDMAAGLWCVPAARMKASRPHTVPLSTDALDLLRHQREAYPSAGLDALVFPALRGGKELSDMALTSLLRKAGAVSDMPGRIATAHGFRSSFRNWAADKGYSAELAERALAHTISNKVQAAYERTDRLDARVAMMQEWADQVSGRVEDAKVVPIARRRRAS